MKKTEVSRQRLQTLSDQTKYYIVQHNTRAVGVSIEPINNLAFYSNQTHDIHIQGKIITYQTFHDNGYYFHDFYTIQEAEDWWSKNIKHKVIKIKTLLDYVNENKIQDTLSAIESLEHQFVMNIELILSEYASEKVKIDKEFKFQGDDAFKLVKTSGHGLMTLTLQRKVKDLFVNDLIILIVSIDQLINRLDALS